jgi:hypothetical protein
VHLFQILLLHHTLYLGQSNYGILFPFLLGVSGGLAMMENDELIDLHQQLEELRLEHRDLDAAINALIETGYPDQLRMSRMKKRKLQLKDTIARIESKLIPDLNA